MRRYVLFGLAIAAISEAQSPNKPTKPPAVLVSASRTKVQQTELVVFTARIREDLMKTIRRPPSGDPYELEPHIIGWHWVPDIDGIDQWTKACADAKLSCSITVHGSGTMVFSIRAGGQVCADWVHIDAVPPPDVEEGRDSLPRIKADSANMAITTKTPTWQRCTA
jgi:hypothetical protein